MNEIQTLEKTDRYFHGLYKDHEIEIEREDEENEGALIENGSFYIRVWEVDSGCHAYDGWMKNSDWDTTIDESIKEALCGSGLI